MPSSTMRSSVLQATAIFALTLVITHHVSESMYDRMNRDEGFMNLTNAFNMSTPFNSTNDTPLRLTLGAADTIDESHNTSRINNTGRNNDTRTNGPISSMVDDEESFYTRRLPREVFVNMVLYALQYCWLIWLERVLPARRRRNEVLHDGKEKVEGSEDREEEVVQRWIAQGRIRRSSLNWCNTFLKWVLAMTIGKLWNHTTGHVLRKLLKFESPKTLHKGLVKHLAFNIVTSFLSIGPLAELIAFIIVPAHTQIVFLAGADLVAKTFLITIIRVFATWAVKTDFAQAMMRNITETTLSRKVAPGFERYEHEL